MKEWQGGRGGGLSTLWSSAAFLCLENKLLFSQDDGQASSFQTFGILVVDEARQIIVVMKSRDRYLKIYKNGCLKRSDTNIHNSKWIISDHSKVRHQTR